MTERPRYRPGQKRIGDGSPPLRLAAAALLVLAGLAWGPWALAAPASATTSAPAVATRLAPITVSGIHYGAGKAGPPTSVYILRRAHITRGRRQANLSESLADIPGVLVRNRFDYAEGEQISIRGFGATAPFGVQGVRLVVDGIPATMPDGQGDPQIIDLPSIERIDVLEGPFSALYGNAAGGVIVATTRDGPAVPTVGWRSWIGGYGSNQITLDGGATSGPLNYFGAFTRFHTDGWRDHSAATRNHVNAKLRYRLKSGGSVTVIGNVLNLEAQDPSGLTAAEMQTDPRQVRSAVLTYGARKNVHNTQGGLVWNVPVGAANEVRAAIYNGHRSVRQFLPFSGDFGLSAGGVVSLADYFGGGNFRFNHAGTMASVPYSVAAGMDYQRENEFRKGFANNSGQQGALRRNEFDVVDSFAQFAQARWLLSRRWSLSAGIRHSQVRFSSQDFYITATNPNDSGSAEYTSTNPVVGTSYAIDPQVHLYFDYGHGFQTPTFYQLAYRPSGQPGLNFALQPMRNDNFEFGMRLRQSTLSVTAAVFHILTHDEIVVASSSNGRTSYMNAGETRRTGFALDISATLPEHLHAHFAYSYLDAHFIGGPYDGGLLPGVPRNRAEAGLRWDAPASGFYTDLTMVLHGSTYADSSNSAFAAGYGLVNWSAGFQQRRARWNLSEFLRLDNLFDRRYVSALVIGDSFGRYYEPGPGRDYTVGISLRRTF